VSMNDVAGIEGRRPLPDGAQSHHGWGR
jgi:hypothetical protein